MTLVTFCPSCSTHFFVTKAQLSANKGKVRCGQCKHVFNANENLSELASSEQKANENNADDLVEATSATINQSIHKEVNEQTSNAELTTESEQIAATEPATDEVAVMLPVTQNLVASAPQLVDFAIKPELVKTEPSQIEDYFAGSSKLKSKSNKKIPRWLLILLLLILLPLAVGQSIYYFRTPIASKFPQTKPYLVQACTLIGCKVELPMHLDLLAIDDSEMREDANHEHVLQFSISLINKANVALAYPSIELSLTDTNDDTVIRRTFTPKEYLTLNLHPAIGNINAGFAAKDRLHIKLALITQDVTVSGYKLELVE